MLVATRIRLYPNASERAVLARQFGCSRWAWNEALAETQRLYRETGKGLGYHAMTQRLPGLKAEHPWLTEANAQVLQQALRNLSRAFVNFFERRGRYPRFKSRRGRQAIQFPQDVRVEDGRRLRLPKVGAIRCILHRELFGTIKTVTVELTPAGRYYASILTDTGVEPPAVSTSGPALGIDLGLTDFAVTSDGRHFANPRHLARAERNLKRKQRKLSRKRKGSNSRNKARLLLARAHERAANARHDWLHKVSRRLVDESQGPIAVEDLNVKGILRSRNFAKAVGDCSWSSFTRFLEYKAAWAGKAFIRVNRFFPSSKACSACGAVNDGLTLKQRRWVCPHCGTAHDRDINAAVNIGQEAERMIMAGIQPATPPGTGGAAGGAGVSRRRGRKPSTTHRA